MNFAEGKGPKQTKKAYALGQFVTIYGNGTQTTNTLTGIGPNGQTAAVVTTTGQQNTATLPYPTTFSGGQVGYPSTSGTTGYATPGSVNPGLNMVSNGLDISLVCSPGAQESIQDIETLTATLSAETGYTSTTVVSLQGTQNRYNPNAYLPVTVSGFNNNNWTTIASVTVSAANTPYLIKVPAASGILYNAYRLIASGGSGIIDWSIPGLFIDFSAQQIGQEATWANGNIAQATIQGGELLTISGGVVTNEVALPGPYENIKANHDYIG